MNAKSILAVAVIGAALLTNGCMTVAGETFGLIKGGQGTFVLLEPREADEFLLADYTKFEIGAMSDATGLVPPDFFVYTATQFHAELLDMGLPDQPGRRCIIEGDVVHYETEGLSGVITSPLEEIVVLARFVDAETGQTLARATCVGRITTRLNKSTRIVAEGLGKAFAAWVQVNYPGED